MGDKDSEAPPERTQSWMEEGESRRHAPAFPFARPSVTTGAKMPWQNKEARPLGPPRAFHSHHHFPSSLPTITMSSAQSTGLPKVVCKPDPAATEQGQADQNMQGSEPQQSSSPFQLDCTQQDNAGSTKSEALGSMELSDMAAEPPVWNPTAGGSLLARAYHTQTSLRSTESTLSYQPPFVSFGSQTFTMNDQAFPPSDLAWIDEPKHQTPPNSLLFSAPVGTSGVHIQPMLNAHSGGAGGSLKRSLSETLLGLSPRPGLQGEGTARMAGIRTLRSLPKRKYGAVDHDMEWDDPSQDNQEDTPKSSGGEDNGGDVTEGEERRLRRRNSNRESARRVKERRNADWAEVNDKVERLHFEQERLLQQCVGLQDSCVGLQRELQELKSRWGDNQAEHQRLTLEVHHLRKNVGMGASGAANSGIRDAQAAAPDMPNAYHGYMTSQGPMQFGSGPGFGGYSGDQYAPNERQGAPFLPSQDGNQAKRDQDWRTWG